MTRNIHVYKIYLCTLDEIILFKNRPENKIQVGVFLGLPEPCRNSSMFLPNVWNQ